MPTVLISISSFTLVLLCLLLKKKVVELRGGESIWKALSWNNFKLRWNFCKRQNQKANVTLKAAWIKLILYHSKWCSTTQQVWWVQKPSNWEQGVQTSQSLFILGNTPTQTGHRPEHPGQLTLLWSPEVFANLN